MRPTLSTRRPLTLAYYHGIPNATSEGLALQYQEFREHIAISPSMSDVKPVGTYVYVHLRSSNLVPFYVGKGTGRRAWSRYRNTRSSHWLRTASKHGVIVKIIRQGMSEICAFTLEKILIRHLEVYGLTNKTTGGEGASGLVMSDDAKKKISISSSDHKVYTFYHDAHGIFHGTRQSLSKQYGVRASDLTTLFSGRQHNVSGWRLTVEKHTHKKIDQTHYVFINSDGGSFSGLRVDFMRYSGLSGSDVCKIFDKKRGVCKGWKCQ